MKQNKIICQHCHKNTYFKLPNSPIFADCCNTILCLACFSHYQHVCQNKKSLFTQPTNIVHCNRCKGKAAFYSCKNCIQKYFCKQCSSQLHSKGKFVHHQYEKIPINQNCSQTTKITKIDKQNPEVLKFRDNFNSPIKIRKNVHDMQKDITKLNMKNQLYCLILNIDQTRSSLTLKQIQLKQNWSRVQNQVNSQFSRVMQVLINKWEEIKAFVQQKKKSQLSEIYEAIKTVQKCQQQSTNLEILMKSAYMIKQQIQMEEAQFLTQKISNLSYKLGQVNSDIKNKNLVQNQTKIKQLPSLIDNLQKIDSQLIFKSNEKDCLKTSKMASSTALSNGSKTKQKQKQKQKQKICIKKSLNQMKKSTNSINYDVQMPQDNSFNDKKKQEETNKRRKNSFGQSQKSNGLHRIKSQKWLGTNETYNNSMKSSFLQNLNDLQKAKQKTKEVFLKKSYIKNIKI